MKTINNYITEKLIINKNTQANTYNYFPKTKEELRKILEERLAKDKNADLNDIDVSAITDMGSKYDTESLFYNLDPHNIDISKWDVSNVTSMKMMFYGCDNFNSDLSEWDVRNVEDMSWMFNFCSKFKGKGLENWKPIKVKNIKYAFKTCKKLTCNLEKWNLNASDVNMEYAFDGCDSLKQEPSWYKRSKYELRFERTTK